MPKPTGLSRFCLPIPARGEDARHGQPLAAHQLLRCRFIAQALSVATSEILMEEAGFERCKPKAPS